MKIDKVSPNCIFCLDQQLETLDHIYLDCVSTNSFLVKVQNFIASNLINNYSDPNRFYLITLLHEDNRVNFLNSVCSWYISRCFQTSKELRWEGYVYYVKFFLAGEKRSIADALRESVALLSELA